MEKNCIIEKKTSLSRMLQGSLRIACVIFLLFAAIIPSGCQSRRQISLFDGKTLGDWKVTDFGGQGDVLIKDGSIILEVGNDLTGIHWTGPLVRMNYEITLEAMRVDGSDFFCGLTFPVGSSPCSLILGGWGGTVCGLSNIDYYDAANNETTRVVSYENGRWYRVRLRVTPDKIEAWLDDEKLVDVVTTGRKISIRPEVDASQPLGIASWRTKAAIRNIRLHPLLLRKKLRVRTDTAVA
jgi:hypothetical protein